MLLRRSAGRRAFKECQQLCVDLILQRRAHTVRRARNHFQRGPFNDWGTCFTFWMDVQSLMSWRDWRDASHCVQTLRGVYAVTEESRGLRAGPAPVRTDGEM